MAESDPLSQMRSQVDAAYAAADRLVREAEAAARERAADIPAAGFEGERTQEERTAFPDIAALAGLLEAARSSLPPELAHQLAVGRARAADRAAGADRLVDRAPGARARGARRGPGHPDRLGPAQSLDCAQMATWILTGSPENYAATAERGYRLIGMKERRRLQAESMEPGDRIVLYLTRVMAFAAAIRLTGELFEDRTPVWPGKPGKADPYPWRFESEPELVLEEGAWLPAESVKDELEHIRKWPAEHWTLAFQGQLRTISEHDARRGARRDACARRRGRRAVSLSGTLRSLPPESRMTGGAALALVVSLFLPWYQVSYFQGGEAVTDSRSALQVFTWIEAAILLVALGVLFLVYARSQRQAFHLPGGDGLVVSLAGGWALAADRVAAVRQARRRRAGRDGRHPVGDLLRAARRRRAGGGRRAGARGRAARAAQPGRRGDRVGGAGRAHAASAPLTLARASTPRSPRSCASARRRGTASRGRRRAARSARATSRTNRRLRPTACSEQLPADAKRSRVDAPRRPRRRLHARAAGRRRRGAAAVAPQDLSRPHTFIDDVSIAFVPSGAGLIGWLLQDGVGAGARGGEAVAARSASGAVGPARSAPRGRSGDIVLYGRSRAAVALVRPVGSNRDRVGAAGGVRERGRRLREVRARRAPPADRAAELRRNRRSVSVAVGPRGDVLVAWVLTDVAAAPDGARVAAWTAGSLVQASYAAPGAPFGPPEDVARAKRRAPRSPAPARNRSSCGESGAPAAATCRRRREAGR